MTRTPPLLALSALSLAYLSAALAQAAETQANDFPKKLYSRTKEEIRAGIKEIEKSKTLVASSAPAQDKASGVDRKATQLLQDGINELNIYRFLCGVPHNVTLDAELMVAAKDAAEACKQAGRWSHDLGHSTEKCNLWTQVKDHAFAVRSYIEDTGAHNRQGRGHRRWCLFSAMAKTGFGLVDGYHALYTMDSSGSASQDSWAYPGKGWFPLERLHGDSWSLYLPQSAPPATEIKVHMWKLLRAPQESLKNPAAPVGKEIKIKAVFTYANAINFEPEIVPKRDTYWIRIEGGGVKEEYLVDLF